MKRQVDRAPPRRVQPKRPPLERIDDAAQRTPARHRIVHAQGVDDELRVAPMLDIAEHDEVVPVEEVTERRRVDRECDGERGEQTPVPEQPVPGILSDDGQSRTLRPEVIPLRGRGDRVLHYSVVCLEPPVAGGAPPERERIVGGS